MVRQHSSTFRGSPRTVEVEPTLDALRPYVGEVVTVRMDNGVERAGQLDSVGLGGFYLLLVDRLGRVTRNGRWVERALVRAVLVHREHS